MKALIAATVALIALTGCDDHKGEHCVHESLTPVVTFIQSGNVLVPITNYYNTCDQWERDR